MEIAGPRATGRPWSDRSALIARLDVQQQPTVRAPRIMRYQPVDHDTSTGQFGNTLGKAEMNRAHRVRIGERCRRERASPKHYLDAITGRANNGIKPFAIHRIDDERDWICIAARSGTPPTMCGATPDLLGRISGSEHLAEKQAQALVRAGDTPAALRRGVQAIVEPPASAPGTRRVVLGHEVSVHELREVLSDRVVIQPEMLSELGNVDGPARVGHVSEDCVASGVAECFRLLLQRRHLIF